MKFDFDKLSQKVSSQKLSNKLSIEAWEGICPFTGLMKSDGYNIEASHILPIGKMKYKSLCKRPLAAIPMLDSMHENFEWMTEKRDIKTNASQRILYIKNYSLIEYRSYTVGYLEAFMEMCNNLGIIL